MDSENISSDPTPEAPPTAPEVAPVISEPVVSTPPAPPPPMHLSPESIQALAGMLSQGMGQAIKPLIPQPPQGPKPWETEDFLKFDDPKTFVGGIQALAEHIADQKYGPLVQRLQQVESILPRIYARSAENPNYSQIEIRARELQSRYGLNDAQALNLAMDETVKAQPFNGGKSVPKFASGPDTRANTNVNLPDGGPLDFGDIVGKLRSSGKF